MNTCTKFQVYIFKNVDLVCLPEASFLRDCVSAELLWNAATGWFLATTSMFLVSKDVDLADLSYLF